MTGIDDIRLRYERLSPRDKRTAQLVLEVRKGNNKAERHLRRHLRQSRVFGLGGSTAELLDTAYQKIGSAIRESSQGRSAPSRQDLEAQKLHKDEMLTLHRCLFNVVRTLSDFEVLPADAMNPYIDLNVAPQDIHAPTKKHKQAILSLAAALTPISSVRGGSGMQQDRVASKLRRLSERLAEGQDKAQDPGALAIPFDEEVRMHLEGLDRRD